MDSTAVKISALQYLIEVILANKFGIGRADECEAMGRQLADHARSRPPNLALGSGPIELGDAQAYASAIADEVERICGNAADRIRTSAK